MKYQENVQFAEDGGKFAEDSPKNEFLVCSGTAQENQIGENRYEFAEIRRLID